MEMFDALEWLRGVVVVVALGAVAILVNKERDVHRTPLARAAGVGAVVLAAVVVLFVGWRVIAPPPPLMEAELVVGQAAVTTPPIARGGVELLVHGSLGPDGHAQGEGSYAVRVTADGAEIAALTGTLRQSVQTRKYMRRGRTNIAVQHLEGRHLLPPAVEGRALALEVTKADGKLSGPLHLELVPAPPPELPILVAGLLLALVGGALDKSTKAAKTWLGLGVAMLFAWAVLLLEAPHPLTLSHLLRSIPVAAVAGGLVGALLRVIGGLLVRRRRASATT